MNVLLVPGHLCLHCFIVQNTPVPIYSMSNLGAVISVLLVLLSPYYSMCREDDKQQ